MVYNPEELVFLTGEVSTNIQLLKMAEFSRLVNLIPDDIVWPPEEERYLWNVYEDVFKENVLFAVSTRTSEEETAYQEAFHLLYDIGDDNSRRDTPMVQAYKQYRDAWFTAQEDYNSHKVEAEFSDDPTAKSRWEQIDEARLRAKINSTVSEWHVKGFKEKVEEAQRVKSSLGSKSPILTWNVWDQMFDRNIDIQFDTDTQPFVPSGISPSNALQADEWLKFSLTGTEVRQLIDLAPTKLRKLLNSTPLDLDIESITFEYTSVGVSRPWFATDVLKARFWKFRNPNQLLSDGKEPPSGRLPAYVAGLIFARRPVVKLKENSSRNQAILSKVSASKPISLGFFNVAPQKTQTMITNMQVQKSASLSLKTSLSPAFQSPTQKATINAALGRMSANNFTRLLAKPGFLNVGIATAQGHQGKQGSQVDSDATQPQPAKEDVDKDIYILGFICKPLPKCPDPDPNLIWE